MSTPVNTSSTEIPVEISVVKQKYDELVKKSLLTRSQFEGQLKEKSKVISDLKVKEGKDIDTMIEMDKQIKFLLSRNMQNLEKQFSKETLHEKDSNSELRAIKGQFAHFIHSKMFELSKYYTNAREILQDFIHYTTMEAQNLQENKTVLKQLKKANASLTQELKECNTNLDESSRALREATSSRDRSQFEGQLREEKSTFANPKYCKKAQSDKPCLYEIPYDTSDPTNRFAPDGEDIVTLEKESRSKLDKVKVKPYNYTYQNSLLWKLQTPSKANP
ncbi:hypothetical protein Tco_0904208 [Tanacetum coccineum]